MTFIRPEARVALWRWREMLAATLLIILGLSWALGAYGIQALAGWGILGLGVVIAVIGAQRMRFRLGGGGPGIVQVDEGQIAYFGPLTGGAVAVSELERLTLDHAARPPHWLLDQPGQAALAIPVNATNTDALFDAFATLPGLRMERMLAELHKSGVHQVVIWERAPTRPTLHRLH
ncbi:hypothetical protein [Phaeobacter porticola]|uniref:Uncharacterized protein n=1 Tax=Phaeobacter porticola TaxID=1844006 RepID=A0A1L3I8K6_9RHOB|nr:hypothetical protein [Phaeobacter porticola]APG48437.1 hypothetical protein PhaeoP97_03062 [Phaeobacter porticola]